MAIHLEGPWLLPQDPPHPVQRPLRLPESGLAGLGCGEAPGALLCLPVLLEQGPRDGHGSA